MFNHTLSAILKGAWFIEDQFANAHLPMVLGILQGTGNLTGQQFLSGAGEFETPFVLQPNGKKVNAYIYTRNGLVLDESAFVVGSIAVVPFVGPLIKYDGDCGEPGMIKRQGWISEMTSQQNCAGYISLLDCPGGQADGTPQLADYIKSINLPKAAVVLGGAYSGGAWIASAHDNIYFADKYGQFGSVGAYSTLIDYSGYFEKQGVKVKSIYPDESKDKNGAYRKALAGDETEFKADVASLAMLFRSSFAQNRGSKLSSEEWNTGKVFNAVDSIRIGLVDGIKPLEEVAASLRSAPQAAPKNSQNQNQNSNMKNFPNVNALVGVECPTPTQMDLANADLTAAGLTKITLVTEESITEAANVTTLNATLTSDLATANAALATANTALATEQTAHQGTKDALAAANLQIAKGPGAKHVGAGGDDEVIKVEVDDIEATLAAMPHNKAADQITG